MQTLQIQTGLSPGKPNGVLSYTHLSQEDALWPSGSISTWQPNGQKQRTNPMKYERKQVDVYRLDSEFQTE